VKRKCRITHWTVNPTVRAQQHAHRHARSNGANATTSDMELGAFVGGEVRGTAQAIYIEPLDAHLFFLTTYANTAGELLRFKLYDDATGTVRDLSETMYFAPNQHQGSIENPVPFELQTTSAGEDFGRCGGLRCAAQSVQQRNDPAVCFAEGGGSDADDQRCARPRGGAPPVVGCRRPECSDLERPLGYGRG
jgi:hypothetical protein